MKIAPMQPRATVRCGLLRSAHSGSYALLILVAATLCAGPPDEHARSRDYSVTTVGFADTVFERDLRLWCDGVRDDINALWGDRRDAGGALRIRSGRGFRIHSHAPLDITIDTAAHVQQAHHFLIRALLRSRIAADRNGTLVSARVVPGWLIAGLQYRADQRQPIVTFSAARLLAEADQAPQLPILLDHEVTPDMGDLYGIYSEICACLVRILRNHNRDVVPALLKQVGTASHEGRSHSTMLYELLGDIGSPEAVQKWFRNMFLDVAVDQHNRLSLASTMHRITALQTFSTIMPGADGRFDLKEIPIDDLVSYSLTYDRRVVGIVPLYEGFFDLLYDGHPLLTDAISQFMKALDYLRTGAFNHYRLQLDSARTKLAEDHQTALQIQAYLGDIENIWNAQPRIAPLVDRVARHEHHLANTEVRLNQFLDKIESEYRRTRTQ